MKHALRVSNLPVGEAFLPSLAGWLLASHGGDPAALARVWVLMPTRRACRALREAFLQVSKGQPILLPRLLPLAEFDAEELSLGRLDESVPPAISPMRRLLHLSRLVARFQETQQQEVRAVASQSAELARQLARFLDEVHREGLDLRKLEELGGDYAGHWQQTVDFLSIISLHWPQALTTENRLDPAARQAELLRRAASAWLAEPPDFPIVAAGLTGGIPPLAALLKVVAGLPQGHVILPGLDAEMPEAEWKRLEPTHPQYGLRMLLEAMDCHRDHVTSLTGEQSSGARQEMLRVVMRPAEATAHWAQGDRALLAGLHGLQLVEAETQLDEARMIAALLRETLETPGRSAALVTPDRQLARMVSAQMRRFGVAVDDSAGQPLSATPPAAFLRLVAETVASGAAPVPLLSLLRHPLAACAMDTADCRILSRRLEIALLRGLRREPGFAPLSLRAGDHPELAGFLRELEEATQPLAECFRQREVSLWTMLDAHIACAERLATTHEESGPSRLWAGEAGVVLAEFVAELREQAADHGGIDPAAYPGLLGVLLSTGTLRPAYGLHPRLHILGPIEARLQRFDRVILAGLNEGTWPPAPAGDPWLSRPMRAAFGLPSAEAAVGQAAHDLMMQAAAPEVFLTRARKVQGTPAVPSRWVVRLKTWCGGLDAGALAKLDATARYWQAIETLDAPQRMPRLPQPSFAPPVEARPRALRVTEIDKWRTDPYMLYASRILALRALDELDEEPDAADFGQMAHGMLEEFARRFPDALPEDPLSALMDCGRQAMGSLKDRPAVDCLWWPRLEAAIRWAAARETERRSSLRGVLGEVDGRWEFEVDGKPFTLTTRIDRLERRLDGSLTLADYKTGAVPDANAVAAGEATQLPLEALIVHHGSLSRPVSGKVTELEYWKLAGNPARCGITALAGKLDGGVESHLARTREQLEHLIRAFDDEQTEYLPRTDGGIDFAHLVRRQEWDPV